MNAVILAAGKASRFAPISYEKPKGFLTVKGEVLIERQIRQLREAGIEAITIVVGYMAERFEYLKAGFGVKIVYNDDYDRYNSCSSLFKVIDELADTYICSSDNYFSHNVFQEKSRDSYYAAVYSAGPTSEYCLETDVNDNIVAVKEGGADSWYMRGHCFVNREFSGRFREILKKEYKLGQTRQGYWEDLYIKHIKELPPFKVRRYQARDIEEFDTLEDLRRFDIKYINDTDCKIMQDICGVLQCEEKDICDISVLKGGMTNSSFVFLCSKDAIKYVYRHPGRGTETFINRKSEYFSMQIIKNYKLDRTFVYMHPTEGWKISYYLENARTLDYHNAEELSQALSLLGRLHSLNITSPYPYRLWDAAMGFLQKIQALHIDDTPDFYLLKDNIETLYDYACKDGWPECLNHCDAYYNNFLIGPDGEMSLIDWEYSGQGDMAQDLGSFIACSSLAYDEALLAIDYYLGHKATKAELRHYLAYVAIASYFWYLWAIYQEANSIDTGDFMSLWHNYLYLYYGKAIELYREQ